jgi:hypothetical protein
MREGGKATFDYRPTRHVGSTRAGPRAAHELTVTRHADGIEVAEVRRQR